MVTIKNNKEIEAMREGGLILAEIMEKIGSMIKVGVSTKDLDREAESQIRKVGATPSFKGHRGGGEGAYPATLCTSLNGEIVHGIPLRDIILKDGDILKVDVGMKYKGMHTDMARTFAVGNIAEDARKIMRTTREALDLGIKKIKSGATLGDYAKAVEGHAKSQNLFVIKDLVGHGVGKDLHEDPYIPNYYSRQLDGFVLKSGMTLALEPMLNEGNSEISMGSDGWLIQTKDGKLSAHFEDTILVTESGCEVLTRKI